MSCFKSLYIPDSIIRLKGDGWEIRGAIENCANLESVYISKGLESIEYRNFSNCPKLTHAIIPENVIEIWSGAFYNCDNLDKITRDRINEIRENQTYSYDEPIE